MQVCDPGDRVTAVHFHFHLDSVALATWVGAECCTGEAPAITSVASRYQIKIQG